MHACVREPSGFVGLVDGMSLLLTHAVDAHLHAWVHTMYIHKRTRNVTSMWHNSSVPWQDAQFGAIGARCKQEVVECYNMSDRVTDVRRMNKRGGALEATL